MHTTLRLVVLIAILLARPGAGETGAPAAPGSVYVVPIRGEIDRGLTRFVDRAIREAHDAGAVGILVEVSTLGGRLDATLEIRDLLVEARLPLAVLVVDRAWSAGVLISLSGDRLFMLPGTSIGAAEPRPLDPKVLSAWRGELESMAERGGRDPLVAAAMADASIAIPGLVEKGEILTLTAKRAAEIRFIDGMVSSRHQALKSAGWEGARVTEIRQRGLESLSRWATSSTVASLLLSLGMFGLIVEISTPGLGVAGAVGLVCLGLFFGGHLIAGVAGWGGVLLFILGLALLSAEAFVPGVGLLGLGGAVSMLLSIYFTIGGDIHAVRTIAVSMVTTLVLTAGFLYTAVRRGWLRKFTLPFALTTASGYVSTQSHAGLLGKAGVAITPLRPAGVARIDHERYDVVSEGGFIGAGTSVMVVHIEGRRVVVRPAEPDEGHGPATGSARYEP
ncbi:MAG TPA: hypothetical protein DCM14_06630 [Clostridiales bacterium UBA8153]|nr:hypothetical protein [Clostridiales bacterium UBA8153]